jgi:hypothetical protein
MTASADITRHGCGGTLLFVREPNGHSYERCSGCCWSYDFDSGRARDNGLSVTGTAS